MYQRLLEHLTTAVLLLDERLAVRWMNPAAEALFAVSLRRMKDIGLAALMSEGAGITAVLAKARDDQQSYTQREARLLPPGGETLTVDYTVTPLSVHELLLEVEPRDRLMQISREEALTARQEAAKVLARGLAHEIKNPLGGIRGAAQLLERELDDPAQHEFTRVIIEEVDRLKALVDAMLGPHREAGHVELNIHRALERVHALLRAEHPPVAIRRDYDPSLPTLYGDQAQLIQALLNVARNAVEALREAQTPAPELVLRTRARRQFTMGARRHRLVCEVSLVDNGPGIPAALQDTLFYPMVSGRAQGSGLGLSIAQAIVHRHQGLIEFCSRPGHTEFRLLIPLESPHVSGR